MDMSTQLSRQRGSLPDKYWYQLNGQSAAENYAEQKQAEDTEDETVIITSEVKIK